MAHFDATEHEISRKLRIELGKSNVLFSVSELCCHYLAAFAQLVAYGNITVTVPNLFRSPKTSIVELSYYRDV